MSYAVRYELSKHWCDSQGCEVERWENSVFCKVHYDEAFGPGSGYDEKENSMDTSGRLGPYSYLEGRYLG